MPNGHGGFFECSSLLRAADTALQAEGAFLRQLLPQQLHILSPEVAGARAGVVSDHTEPARTTPTNTPPRYTSTDQEDVVEPVTAPDIQTWIATGKHRTPHLDLR